MTQINIAIVNARFHKEIADTMAKTAKSHAGALGLKVVEMVNVPGVFDMPLVVKKLMERENVHGIVVLGCVMKGETEHDRIVAFTTAKSLQKLTLKFNKPVGYGISGPGINLKQATVRAVDYAKRAVEVIVKYYEFLDGLNEK